MFNIRGRGRVMLVQGRLLLWFSTVIGGYIEINEKEHRNDYTGCRV